MPDFFLVLTISTFLSFLSRFPENMNARLVDILSYSQECPAQTELPVHNFLKILYTVGMSG